ncbi:MAG: hypothetical protein H6Q20_1829 [Bacteroidetes bacterium]|nr:hypothetical protein [Bacteroidota bacterium]
MLIYWFSDYYPECITYKELKFQNNSSKILFIANESRFLFNNFAHRKQGLRKRFSLMFLYNV